MEIFNYIDTFFFISLGITFVLILLLVFHFKQRVSLLEEKTDTMFEIINNVVKEIVSIKNMILQSSQFNMSTSYLNPNIRNVPIINETMRFDNNNNKIDHQSEGEEQSEEEQSEAEEQSEDEQSEAEEEQSEDEQSEDEEEQSEESDDEDNTSDIEYITPALENDTEQIKLITVTVDDVEELKDEILIEKVESNLAVEESVQTNKEDTMDLYRKMSLPALKTLLITKGLASDPSKMKKYDILKLLENNLDDDE
jgi:cell division protein FtsN